MLLTVSKRLEFSASRRLFVRRWTNSENLVAFGPETRARYGTGRNYIAYFIFSGPVNPTNGMLINISEMKERAGRIVHGNFDHKFLMKTIRRLPTCLRQQRILRDNFISMLRRYSLMSMPSS